jgi:hypothetical protein
MDTKEIHNTESPFLPSPQMDVMTAIANPFLSIYTIFMAGSKIDTQ